MMMLSDATTFTNPINCYPPVCVPSPYVAQPPPPCAVCGRRCIAFRKRLDINVFACCKQCVNRYEQYRKRKRVDEKADLPRNALPKQQQETQPFTPTLRMRVSEDVCQAVGANTCYVILDTNVSIKLKSFSIFDNAMR